MTEASEPVGEVGEAVDQRPPVLQDASFWGMTFTQFLGAFNDNLYKQLMLLLAVPIALGGAAAVGVSGPDSEGAAEGASVAASATFSGETTEGEREDGADTGGIAAESPVTAEAAKQGGNGVPGESDAEAGGGDVQGWATLVFSLPFVLFSGFAGYLSDRFSKTPIIVACKLLEILVMLLGTAAFYFYSETGWIGTWLVLFLMGTQSSFFGPGKYGILPELFRATDLPRANGIILMTTFLAIIFGTVSAGFLKKALGADGATEQLWLGLLICVGIGVLGTLTSLMIKRVPAAQPELKLSGDCWAVSSDVYRMLKNDRTLLLALLVSCVFWLVSGIAVPTVNRLGLGLLGVGEDATSILTASIGLGIMVGALLASRLCRGGHGDRLVTVGLTGITAALSALGFWMPDGTHALGYWGSVVALITMGVFAAIFAIPLQVFLQERPPAALKGRMIATMNQANFVGILISGPLYQAFEAFAGGMGWAISSVFWMMGLLLIPLIFFYRLDSSQSPNLLVATE